MSLLSRVAVVIPVAPHDDSWSTLIDDLKEFPGPILIVSPEKAPLSLSNKVAWIVSSKGRAVQLNAGAKAAQTEYLWFLHADSRLTPNVFPALETSLNRSPEGLHYFNLRFVDGSALMRINECGLWIRSHVLGMPFGDQGFAIAKRNCDRLGGFDEWALFGEDHLFVWKARQRGIPVCCAGATLGTSARKYKQGGWLGTTLAHLRLTYQQAVPEMVKLVLSKEKNPREKSE